MSNQQARNRRPLSLQKKVSFTVITVVAALALLELAARLVVPPPDVLVHREHESLIAVGGLPALNETMEFDPVLFWRLTESLENHAIKGANGQFEIDFTVTIREHYRGAPPAERKQAPRILVLGDSCAFGVGVEDDQTWPCQLERDLRDAGHDVSVINAGVPGYTAYQGLKFLERNVDRLQPDLVICCFGFNDLDTWASRSDVETAELLQAQWRRSKLLHWSRLLWGADQALEHAGPHQQPEGAGRPRLMPAEFVSMLSGIRLVCDRWHARMVLLVWPSRDQVEARDTQLLLYQLLSEKYGERFDVPVVDLVPEFVSADEELFVDHVHANELGCSIVATSVAKSVTPLLQEPVR
jgi:lysophospholipase L1-like esterase